LFTFCFMPLSKPLFWRASKWNFSSFQSSTFIVLRKNFKSPASRTKLELHTEMQIALISPADHITSMLHAQKYIALQSNVLYLEYMVTGHKQMTQSFSKLNHRKGQLQISQSQSVRSLDSNYTNEKCKLIRNGKISIKYSRNLKWISAFWLG